jgi:hypothetical protein
VRELFLARYEPVPFSGCWIWTGFVNRYGYGKIKDGEKPIHAHRVSYELFRGPIPTGMFVCHTCDVRCCVNPAHLFIGTIADNNRDRDRKLRHKPLRGEMHGGAKLTQDQVREIRASKESLRKTAKKYGVQYCTISAIKNGRLWGWLV